MSDWLRVLYAEQTTADEVVVFLLLGAAAVLAIAFAFYVALLFTFWLLHLRGKERLRAVLLPSRERARLYAAEYSLAALTAFLLTLSVATRHQVVEAVLSQPVDDISVHDIARAFPIQPPTTAELVALGVSQQDAQSTAQVLTTEIKASENPEALLTGGQSLAVGNLLRPLLKAGLPENADVIVKASVIALGDRIKPAFPTRAHLIVIAVLLLIAYALWFAWRRSSAIAKHSAGDTEYASVARRLMVPALCIPLLLVSAAAAENPERIARSVAAVAAVSESEEVIETALRTAVTRQAETARIDVAAEEVSGELQKLRGELDSHHESLKTLATEHSVTRSSVDTLDSNLSSLGPRVDELRSRMGMFDQRLAGLENEIGSAIRTAGEASARNAALLDSLRVMRANVARLEALLTRRGVGYLLVFSQGGEYQVHSDSPNGPVRATGTRLGLHALAPGSYVVTSPRGGSARATVGSGTASTAQLTAEAIVR